MLDNQIPSRLASYIIIGVLVAAIMFLCIKVGIYEGDIRTANIVRKWAEGENETLKEREKQYIEGFQYYQSLLSSGFTLTQDATLMLKKGTFIIPPVEEKESLEE